MARVIKTTKTHSATAAVYASNLPSWLSGGVCLDSEGNAGITVEDALQHSGLDFEVKKIPIYGEWNGAHVKVDGRFGVQRQDTGLVLGTVGKTWQPVQNRDGFAVLESLLNLAGGDIWIESAGEMDNGRKVWIMARSTNALSIAGEQYHSYLGFTNGHDGRTSVTAFCTDIRLACANALTWTVENAVGLVRVRHTTKASDRLVEAHKLLGLRNARLDELARQGEWLVDHTMGDAEFATFLENLMPISDPGTPAATMIGQRREAVSSLYFDAPNLAPIRGTRWGAAQAVCEYVDHGRATKNHSSVIKTQFGLSASPLKDRALTILTVDGKIKPLV